MIKLGKKLDDNTFKINNFIIHVDKEKAINIFESEEDLNKWFKGMRIAATKCQSLYYALKYIDEP